RSGCKLLPTKFALVLIAELRYLKNVTSFLKCELVGIRHSSCRKISTIDCDLSSSCIRCCKDHFTIETFKCVLLRSFYSVLVHNHRSSSIEDLPCRVRNLIRLVITCITHRLSKDCNCATSTFHTRGFTRAFRHLEPPPL